MTKWEVIHEDESRRILRFRIKNGWLYNTEYLGEPLVPKTPGPITHATSTFVPDIVVSSPKSSILKTINGIQLATFEGELLGRL